MDTQHYYKSPLTIYVIWHPANVHGVLFGEALYNSFCRDTNSPLVRALGIPVWFRYAPEEQTGLPIPVDIGESDNNAMILLVDDAMFADSRWYGYVSELLDKQDDAHTRLYPVALSDYAFSLDEERLNKKQFINLAGLMEDPVVAISELKSRLLHDLCRLLFKIEKAADAGTDRAGAPVNLFISHAKVDGEKLAANFRDYILQNLKLKTFFDVNDIADADDFAMAISANVENSAVVVFLSDQYSTREWCLIEVIVAKRNKSPLVVVNNLEHGEKRSFPYLGNVPTLRYKENCFPAIVDLALYQVLNNLYIKLKLEKEIALYGLKEKYTTYQIQNAPELFTYLDIKRLQENNSEQPAKKVLVIYPDPSLGKEELRVLDDMDENIQFITPSLIHKLL